MCSVLNDEELQNMSDISDGLFCLPNEVICAEGETAKFIYNIRAGCVRISKMLPDGRRQIIGFLFAGDFFGLSNGDGHSYSAEAITSVDLCKISQPKLFQNFQKLPVLGQKVLNMSLADLNDAAEKMLLLGRKNAKEKLCSFLLVMSKKSSLMSEIPIGKIYLPMSRSDIADYLGLTIETISRQFTILANDNIIAMDKSPIIDLLNLQRLELIASGE
ncbi:MAG: helix-turn-helix domain-containing protein [Kordiimonadaceae bacterium]|nr:helix-turn-helix domain-containing protein [Kordiimonadaceae bacterium]